ncbi:hypothetical protein CJF30_00007588 [Rutstroemia sp. NJR-2017a BBW]|nr:hypothetical protein CJF30_00007588 [Rutstroemia sp. NJR-2017a BBW]
MSGVGFNPNHGGDSGPLPYIPQMGYSYPTPGYWPQVPYGGVASPGYGMPGQYPAPEPTSDGGVPGVHLRNQFGGVGLPPGYNYLFPKSHCMIHGSTPPWQASTPLYNHDARNHKKFFVPANMTVGEMMKALGCNNEKADKNVLTEVTEAGNGRWLRGMKFSGGNGDKMKKKLHELGWNIERKRSGLPGQGPVIWVYVTND